MNETAVIICNYNGGSDTVRCIDSVLGSDGIRCDVYVIDNASADNSVSLIEKEFGSLATIVRNEENLGGSGGFGRGIRMAVEKKYPYIMLLDNDAYVDSNTIKVMHDYLKEHLEAGIVGAKIMMADDPGRIMDYAKTINFMTFMDESEWCGQPDSAEASIPRECDFAAATAAMVRRDTLLKCGGMDEENFIYYDDIELGYRIKSLGYRVISLGNVKAWHKSGMRQKRTNTFARYYLARNRNRFFAKYIQEKDIERFTEHVLSRAFSFLYGSHYKGRKDIFGTEKYILEDFMADRRGKAGEGRINNLQADGYRRIEEEMTGSRSVLVYLAQDVPERCVAKFCSRLWEREPEARIAIGVPHGMKEKADACLGKLMDEPSGRRLEIKPAGEAGAEDFDKIIRFCSHVKDVKENILPEIYIDAYENMIASEQDYIYFKNYDNSYAFFKALYHDSMIQAIYRIRKEGILCQRYQLSCHL